MSYLDGTPKTENPKPKFTPEGLKIKKRPPGDTVWSLDLTGTGTYCTLDSKEIQKPINYLKRYDGASNGEILREDLNMPSKILRNSISSDVFSTP